MGVVGTIALRSRSRVGVAGAVAGERGSGGGEVASGGRAGQCGAVIRCSRRLPWETSPNAQSQLLDALRARGAAVLDLATSNPTRVGLPYPAERIAAALADRRAA